MRYPYVTKEENSYTVHFGRFEELKYCYQSKNNLSDGYLLHIAKNNFTLPTKVGVPANFVDNGCTFSPDWLPSTGSLSEVCRVHDYMYSIGGNKYDRKIADLIMRKAIAKKGLNISAYLYYYGARLGGKKYFNWSE